MSRLSVDSFVPVSTETIWPQLDAFLYDWEPPASRSDLDLGTIVGTTIDNADELFQLQGSESDLGEFPWLVQEFREFVAIDRDQESVLVLTTSVD